LVENRLKKLNGLRLGLPSLSMVLAKQIGLGAMACWSQCCFSKVDIFERSIYIDFSNRREREKQRFRGVKTGKLFF
jgi:hypothetical protein